VSDNGALRKGNRSTHDAGLNLLDAALIPPKAKCPFTPLRFRNVIEGENEGAQVRGGIASHAHDVALAGRF